MGIDLSEFNDRQRSLMEPADRKKLGKRGETFLQAEKRRVTRTERDIHYKFISFLKRHEIPYTHSSPIRKSSIKKGHPDFLVGLRDNRGFYAEFKIPPNNLTKEQKEQIAFLERNGNTVIVAEETSPGAAYTAAIRETGRFFNLDISNDL
jgi:hypothetical protein